MDENTLNWENTPCDWCGEKRSINLFFGPDWLEDKPGEFTMAKCINCGLFRQNPRLSWDSLKEYYPKEYAAYTPISLKREKKLTNLGKNYGYIKRKRFIKEFKVMGKLLDIGCGTGKFLREMSRDETWDIVGIEPNQFAFDTAKNIPNINIYQGRFREISFQKESFDVITLWNVLEHLEQPIEDLRYAYDILKNNGLIVFTIPNYSSIERVIFNRYWSGWDLPRHLYIFPRRLIKKILADIGFQILAERCIASSYHSLGHSLDFWLKGWVNKYLPIQRLISRFYYSLPIRMVMIFPLYIQDKLKLSGNITLIAKKSSS